MRCYEIPFQAETDWGYCPSHLLTDCGWTSAPAKLQVTAQLSCDGEALHVRMRTDGEKAIRATLTGKLDQVCDDSCMEFFFAPKADDPRYFNFEWNKLGALSLSFGTLRASRVRQVPKNAKELFRFQSREVPNGWIIEYAIPLDFIRTYYPDYTFTGEAAGNFYKCGDQTVTPHFLSWNPMTAETPDFHRRGDFGTLVFLQK